MLIMKIVIPGGSGQVGTVLARAFHADGHDVVVLGRSMKKSPWRFLEWNAKSFGDWIDEIEGADVVINLAGRSVNCRYNETNRKEIMDSRVDSTRILGAAIANAKRPPKLWLQASTATIYAHRFDQANDEFTGIIGGAEDNVPKTWKFSIDVAIAWEKTANEIETPATRKILMRSALTLSPDRGGIFDVLLGLVRKGLGGKAGDGKQFISWIHETDFINAIRFVIDREEISGVVNFASPNPLPNEKFMRILREAAGVPIGLPATKWMLELGAIFMRTETELILKSRRVLPTRLLQSGFKFQFSDWKDAARELCARSRV